MQQHTNIQQVHTDHATTYSKYILIMQQHTVSTYWSYNNIQ